MTEPDEKMIDDIGPIWRELCGGVWHTTHPDRFLSILNAGAILPEPSIPNGERWGVGLGPDHYPFVRSIGGVSLFDFRDFDPVTYQENYPVSMWRTFVPYQRRWAGAIWLEVDCEKTEAKFVSAQDLLERRVTPEDRGRNILPNLEAAHIGNLPISSIRRALFIRAGDEEEFHEFSCSSFDRAAYEALLPEWREELEFASLPLTEQIKLRPPDFSNAPHDPDLAERIIEAKKRLKKWRPKN